MRSPELNPILVADVQRLSAPFHLSDRCLHKMMHRVASVTVVSKPPVKPE